MMISELTQVSCARCASLYYTPRPMADGINVCIPCEWALDANAIDWDWDDDFDWEAEYHHI